QGRIIFNTLLIFVHQIASLTQNKTYQFESFLENFVNFLLKKLKSAICIKINLFSMFPSQHQRAQLQ
uniref:Ovule protein n=1 Tax=Romanomermis culicivorax TaxID=13658 RepID=A0A915KZD9_ROMCU